MPKRRPGALFPIEADILGAAIGLAAAGRDEFHGYELAQKATGAQLASVGPGTIYRALQRLEQMGFLEGRWEAARIATAQGRPRRRYYRLTAEGRRTTPATDERPVRLTRLVDGWSRT